MEILSKTYSDIINFFKAAPVESGGILGVKNDIICAFYPDETAQCRSGEYIPNIFVLNRIIEEWALNGIAFAGIIHSHPNNQKLLSRADKEYAQKIIECSENLKKIYFPIVVYNENDVEIVSYVFDNKWNCDDRIALY